MKIKQIKWKKSLLGFHATLPLQLHARISQQGELFKWSIMRGTASISSYFAKTMEQAKEDCERTWEEMVMECFEPVGKGDKLGG